MTLKARIIALCCWIWRTCDSGDAILNSINMMKDPNLFVYGTLMRDRRSERHDLLARCGGVDFFGGMVIIAP